MVIIYALCWLPLHCVTVLGDLQPTIWNFEGIQLVWIACHWLAMSSCCWNPIVYYWTNDTLRAGFTYALGTWCPCVRRTTKPPTICRRQVVYQATQHGRDVHVERQVKSDELHPSCDSVRITTHAWRTTSNFFNSELRSLQNVLRIHHQSQDQQHSLINRSPSFDSWMTLFITD